MSGHEADHVGEPAVLAQRSLRLLAAVGHWGSKAWGSGQRKGENGAHHDGARSAPWARTRQSVHLKASVPGFLHCKPASVVLWRPTWGKFSVARFWISMRLCLWIVIVKG
jgi:hypothetical protein